LITSLQIKFKEKHTFYYCLPLLLIGESDFKEKHHHILFAWVLGYIYIYDGTKVITAFLFYYSKWNNSKHFGHSFLLISTISNDKRYLKFHLTPIIYLTIDRNENKYDLSIPLLLFFLKHHPDDKSIFILFYFHRKYGNNYYLGYLLFFFVQKKENVKRVIIPPLLFYASWYDDSDDVGSLSCKQIINERDFFIN
jgi:hypothetical protein